MSARLPFELTVSELAAMLGVPRYQIAYRVKVGRIPSHRVGRGEGRGAKRVVFVHELREHCPEYWNGLLFRARVGALVPEPDDDFDDDDL